MPRDYGKLSALLEVSEELADKIHGMGLGHNEERVILSVFDLQSVMWDLLGEERSDTALSNLLEAIASVGPFTVADVKTAWREFEKQGLRPPGVDDVVYFGYFLFQRAEKFPPKGSYYEGFMNWLANEVTGTTETEREQERLLTDLNTAVDLLEKKDPKRNAQAASLIARIVNDGTRLRCLGFPGGLRTRHLLYQTLRQPSHEMMGRMLKNTLAEITQWMSH